MSFKGHTLLGGTVRASDECYLISTNDNHATSTLWRWDGSDWNSHTVNWPAVSGTVCSVPNSRYLALGKWGEVEADPTGTWTSETGVDSSGKDPTKRGPLKFIRSVAGTALAVGADRQVYERVASAIGVVLTPTVSRPRLAMCSNVLTATRLRRSTPPVLEVSFGNGTGQPSHSLLAPPQTI